MLEKSSVQSGACGGSPDSPTGIVDEWAEVFATAREDHQSEDSLPTTNQAASGASAATGRRHGSCARRAITSHGTCMLDRGTGSLRQARVGEIEREALRAVRRWTESRPNECVEHDDAKLTRSGARQRQARSPVTTAHCDPQSTDR